MTGIKLKCLELIMTIEKKKERKDFSVQVAVVRI